MISACLIVKNEEHNIYNCLKSIQKYVDEIIIADTGSSDRTIEIAKLFNANIITYQWNNDFSSARNFVKSFAKYDFILCIDADETLLNGEFLREICSKTPQRIGAYLVNIISFNSKNNQYSILSPQIRLFRNNPNFKFTGLVHEQIIDSIISNKFEIAKSKLNFLHSGYNQNKEELFKKYERNLFLINKELENNYSEYYLIHKARTLLALEKNDDAENIIRNSILNSDIKNSKIESLNILADMYLSKKILEQAANYYLQSFELDNTQLYVISQLANIYFHLENYEKSLLFIDLLEEKISNNYNLSAQPIINYKSIIFKKSKLLLISKKFLSALEYMNSKLPFFADDADILYLYSNAHFKNGNYELAIKYLQKAKNIGVNSTKIDLDIEKIQKIINQLNNDENENLLSLCMIVKNEEKYLEDCLKSVVGIVDEIIIVDTGSTDKTIEISKKFTDKIYYFEWVNDFSLARNESIKYAKGKWILYLDADERLFLHNPISFKELLKNSDESIGAINCIIESIVKNSFNESEVQSCFYPRIFRNYKYPNIKFEGKIHEQILPSLNRLNKSLIDSDIIIKHLGYNASEEIINKKINRNLRLLKESLEENPNDGYILFQLGQTYIMIRDFENAKISLELALKKTNISSAIRSSILNILSQFAGIDGDFNKALLLVNESLSITENQELGLAIKAEALNKLGNYKEALLYYKKLLFYKKNKSPFIETGFDITINESKIISIINKLSE